MRRFRIRIAQALVYHADVDVVADDEAEARRYAEK